MTRSGVAFLAVQDFRSEIYWIVSKAGFDFLPRDVVAGDVSCVWFIPIEASSSATNSSIHTSYVLKICSF
jgi:hypothetical protein